MPVYCRLCRAEEKEQYMDSMLEFKINTFSNIGIFREKKTKIKTSKIPVILSSAVIITITYTTFLLFFKIVIQKILITFR